MHKYAEFLEKSHGEKRSPTVIELGDVTCGPVLKGAFGGGHPGGRLLKSYPANWADGLRSAQAKMGEHIKAGLVAEGVDVSTTVQAIAELREHVAVLSREVASLKGNHPGMFVPIQTFEPEPYELIARLEVVVRQHEEEFMATFAEAKLSAMGDTLSEAVNNLKTLMLDVFDSLSGRPAKKLGPAPAKQLAVLGAFIRKRP